MTERKFSMEDRATLRRLHGEGLMNGEIAEVMDFSNSTITKWLQRMNLPRNSVHLRRKIVVSTVKERLQGRPQGSPGDKPVAPVRDGDALLAALQAGRR